MDPRTASRPASGAQAPSPLDPNRAATSAAPTDAYLPGDLVLSRDGRTQWVIEKDGSWKKLAAAQSVEDSAQSRRRHAQDHRRVSAHKLEQRSGLITPETAGDSPLILGADAEREFKKLTGRK